MTSFKTNIANTDLRGVSNSSPLMLCGPSVGDRLWSLHPIDLGRTRSRGFLLATKFRFLPPSTPVILSAVRRSRSRPSRAARLSRSIPSTPDDPMFPGQHLYYKFIDFDPGLTGPWEIIPTDSTGTGSSTFTNAIAEPEFLPLVENITVQGTPLGARVAWTLPNLDGFDVDGLVVRVIEATSGGHMWQSDLLPCSNNQFSSPSRRLAGRRRLCVLGHSRGRRR